MPVAHRADALSGRPYTRRVVQSVSSENAATRIVVRVRLFASYREAAGTGKLDLQLPAGASVNDLMLQLEERVPTIFRARGLVAVNQEYVGPDFLLRDGDEVAFLPPVSGGATSA